MSLMFISWIMVPENVKTKSPVLNKLTKAEKKEGWKLLFDGKTLNGWKASENPSSWRKRQIGPFKQSGTYFPALAGMGLGENRYIESYRKIARPDTAWQWLIELMMEQSRGGVK